MEQTTFLLPQKHLIYAFLLASFIGFIAFFVQFQP